MAANGDFLLARVGAGGELVNLTEDDIRLWMFWLRGGRRREILSPWARSGCKVEVAPAVYDSGVQHVDTIAAT